MQTNGMIWDILFSDIDLSIFKNKKEECYALLQEKSISQTGTLSNYIPMFSFSNNYIATPLITIEPIIKQYKTAWHMEEGLQWELAEL
jgi:hypothetical protein